MKIRVNKIGNKKLMFVHVKNHMEVIQPYIHMLRKNMMGR